MHVIGEDVAEMLDIVPAQYRVKVIRRPSGVQIGAEFNQVTERICYGIELDPKYVDVAVQRWQTLSGKKAKLEADGRTFEEIADERRKAGA